MDLQDLIENKIVYLSGPMRGHANNNAKLFSIAEEFIGRYRPLKVFNPCNLELGLARTSYMRKDIAALLDCELAVFLPGWFTSQGARLEHEVARECGLDRLFLTNPNALVQELSFRVVKRRDGGYSLSE